MQNQNKVFSTQLSHVLLIYIIFIIINGCMRSPFVESVYQNCLNGDQVIVNAKLFCVYQDSVESRPIDDMENPLDTQDALPLAMCPEFVPHASSYSYLTICSEDENPDDSLIEVVVAQWTEQTLESSSNPLDQGPSSTLDFNPMPPSPIPDDLADL